MRKFTLFGLLVCSIFTFGCPGLVEDPIEIPSGDDIYGGGSENNEIVFSSSRSVNYDIYRMDPYDTTAEPQRITKDPGRDDQPSYDSYNGDIVFISDRDNPEGEIYMYSSTGALVRLTQNSDTEAHPHLSAATGTIVFESVRNTRSGISSMNKSGTDITELIGYDGSTYENPRWNNDGSKIAFVSNRVDPPNYNIYVMDRDGNNVTRVTTDLTDPGGLCYTRINSTNWIYFHLGYGMGGIWRVREDGVGMQQLLSSGSSYIMNPCISPNGADMVYEAFTNGNWEIMLLHNHDLGGGSSNITQNPGVDVYAKFSGR